MPTTQLPSADQLKRALEIAESIQKLESELAEVLGNGSQPAPAPAAAAVEEKSATAKTSRRSKPAKAASKPGKPGKRVVSDEARAKMAEAARKRWAARKGVE